MVGRVDYESCRRGYCFLPDTCHDECGKGCPVAGFGEICRNEEGAEGDGEVCQFVERGYCSECAEPDGAESGADPCFVG